MIKKIIDIIAYISLVIIIIFIILRIYEYYYTNKMKKTRLKYIDIDIDEIKTEKIKYILYYKHNIRTFFTKYIIGKIISHSSAVVITDKGNVYLISNDAVINNKINIYHIKISVINDIFTFNNLTYKLIEIIDSNDDIYLDKFLKKMIFNINNFKYDITGYNCHMLFLDTFADFKIKAQTKNICGFLPSLNQIILDIFSIDSYL